MNFNQLTVEIIKEARKRKLPKCLIPTIRGDIHATSYGLVSLEGSPKFVPGNFWCYRNRLTTLKGAPEQIGENFFCNNNLLTSLEGAPKYVGYSFHCHNNKHLTSLEGIPNYIGGDFWCFDTALDASELAKWDLANKVKGNIYFKINPNEKYNPASAYPKAKCTREYYDALKAIDTGEQQDITSI